MAHAAIPVGCTLKLLTKKCVNLHSAHLVFLLEIQLFFHFILSSNAEILRDFSRLLGDLLFHCRVIALTFPSFHRDRSENKTVLREDILAVGQVLKGLRNRETGNQYLPEKQSYDEIAAFCIFTHPYLLSFSMVNKTNTI